MKVSLNIIKQFIDFELPPVDQLVDTINQQLGGVEEVIDLASKYKDALIVRVVECEKHPDADRLSVTKIDDGGVSDAPRDENGLIQVVCGAPNVHAGMLAVWLPPKSTVPSSFGDDEPFVLEARKLRGVLSQGMMAASDELGFDNNHETIIEINPDEWRPYDEVIAPGASFAKCFGLDDTVIDIENKMFTHRPDLFGQLGVAREISGILGHRFVSPIWYSESPTFDVVNDGFELKVFNDAAEKVPRFVAVAMDGIEIKPSPMWLQAALVAMGSKPINNIVDITNYVMLMTAQPVHAYDYDKLRGHTLGARMANMGEKITLLNHKTYELSTDDIVIVDGEGPVGLAGIMGGGDSEVDENTKRIVLEVATFDMYTVRKSAMRHGVFTDALTRFNKGQSPLQNDRIAHLLMSSIKDILPARQASKVHDLGELKSRPTVELDAVFINKRLGLDLPESDIRQLLENVEIDSVDSFRVTPPFWRTDIELPEDVVEEVGRLYGFDKLPRELPRRSIRPVALNSLRATKNRLRTAMARFGANEVLTYSFVHKNIIDRAGQDAEKAFRLSNALSPDLQYYRLSVVPSLLAKVNANVRAGHHEFALFEIGKAHHKDEFEHKLPREYPRIAAVYVSKTDHSGAAYFNVKNMVSELLEDSAVKLLSYKSLSDIDMGSQLEQMVAPFDPKRTALVYSGDVLLGVVGEFKDDVTRKFKLPVYAAGFELFVDVIRDLSEGSSGSYQPLGRFPSTAQDLSLKLSRSVSYQDLTALVTDIVVAKTTDANLRATISPQSIYVSKEDEKTRVVTYHIEVSSDERTLREDEVTAIVDAIVDRANQKFQAVQS